MGESLWSYGDLTLCFLFDGSLKQGCSKLLKVDRRQFFIVFSPCVWDVGSNPDLVQWYYQT